MTRDEALAALARFRDEIDALDLELLALLNRRTKVVEEIGRVKEAVSLPIYEPKREGEVFRNVIEHNTGPLTRTPYKEFSSASSMKCAACSECAGNKETSKC